MCEICNSLHKEWVSIESDFYNQINEVDTINKDILICDCGCDDECRESECDCGINPESIEEEKIN